MPDDSTATGEIPMNVREYVARLTAQRDRLTTAIDALMALGDDGPTGTPVVTTRHQNGARTPAQGRQATKTQRAAPTPPAKKRAGPGPAWDVVLGEKLWKAKTPVAEIAKRAGTKPASIYDRARCYGWGARQRHKKAVPASTVSPRRVAARTDLPARTCAGCGSRSTTNPCHCGHIHG